MSVTRTAHQTGVFLQFSIVLKSCEQRSVAMWFQIGFGVLFAWWLMVVCN